MHQAKSDDWYKQREWRITASRFGEITHMTERRNINKLCDSLLNSGHLTTAAILHGRQNESTARKKFEEVTGLSVSNCGLFIREDLPFLAASPDGLVGDDQMSLHRER